MFYRFMNDGNIKWRKLLYAMNLQLLRKISRSTEAEHDKPVCLIIDDTINVKQYVLVAERIGYADRAKEVIYETLTDAGIPIPFPQCEVHLVSDAKE